MMCLILFTLIFCKLTMKDTRLIFWARIRDDSSKRQISATYKFNFSFKQHTTFVYIIFKVWDPYPNSFVFIPHIQLIESKYSQMDMLSYYAEGNVVCASQMIISQFHSHNTQACSNCYNASRRQSLSDAVTRIGSVLLASHPVQFNGVCIICCGRKTMMISP